MCGHVGMAGDVYSVDLEVFRQLLWVDAIRGFHGTGAAVVSGGGKVTINKVQGSTMRLFCEADFHKSLTCTDRVFIGHNRHATVGSHEAENSHPFEFSHIVGAHNGTLNGRSRHKLPDFNKFGTDSEALYHNINEFGIEEVIPEIEGAWALVWYNKAEHTINFLRNTERPLCYCFNDKGTMMYWASEGWMLKGILEKNNIKIGSQGILSIKPDTWIRFDIPRGNKAFQLPFVQELKGWVSPPFLMSPWSAEAQDDRWGVDDIVGGWSPHPGGKDVSNHHVPNEQDSKPKNSRGKKQNVPAVLPGLPGSTKTPSLEDGPIRKPNSLGLTIKKEADHPENMGSTMSSDGKDFTENSPAWSRSIKSAFDMGERHGREGRSKSHCPFTPGSIQYKTYQAGRNKGFEAATAEALKPGANVPALPQSMRGYNGELLSERQFRERTGSTCRCCDDVVEFGTPVKFFNPNDFFCIPCVDQDNQLRAVLDKIVA